MTTSTAVATTGIKQPETEVKDDINELLAYVFIINYYFLQVFHNARSEC